MSRTALAAKAAALAVASTAAAVVGVAAAVAAVALVAAAAAAAAVVVAWAVAPAAVVATVALAASRLTHLPRRLPLPSPPALRLPARDRRRALPVPPCQQRRPLSPPPGGRPHHPHRSPWPPRPPLSGRRPARGRCRRQPASRGSKRRLSRPPALPPSSRYRRVCSSLPAPAPPRIDAASPPQLSPALRPRQRQPPSAGSSWPRRTRPAGRPAATASSPPRAPWRPPLPLRGPPAPPDASLFLRRPLCCLRHRLIRSSTWPKLGRRPSAGSV